MRLGGGDRLRLLERVSTNRTDDFAGGKARYAVLTDGRGVALDDKVVHATEGHFLVVVNASNCEQDLAWLR